MARFRLSGPARAHIAHILASSAERSTGQGSFNHGPQLLGAHPVDASGTGVLPDASERVDEILARREPLPQARLGG